MSWSYWSWREVFLVFKNWCQALLYQSNPAIKVSLSFDFLLILSLARSPPGNFQMSDSQILKKGKISSKKILKKTAKIGRASETWLTGKIGGKRLKTNSANHTSTLRLKYLSKKGLKSFSFLVVGTLVEREKLRLRLKSFHRVKSQRISWACQAN